MSACKLGDRRPASYVPNATLKSEERLAEYVWESRRWICTAFEKGITGSPGFDILLVDMLVQRCGGSTKKALEERNYRHEITAL